MGFDHPTRCSSIGGARETGFRVEIQLFEGKTLDFCFLEFLDFGSSCMFSHLVVLSDVVGHLVSIPPPKHSNTYHKARGEMRFDHGSRPTYLDPRSMPFNAERCNTRICYRNLFFVVFLGNLFFSGMNTFFSPFRKFVSPNFFLSNDVEIVSVLFFLISTT